MELDTGDILLFSARSGIFSGIIKFFTQSQISHVGMILKEPTWIHPSLKGTFLWESGWEGTPDPQDGQVKFGVQITPLEEILQSYQKTKGKIYVRRAHCEKDLFTTENLESIHKVVYNKVYDIVPKDWFEAMFRKDDDPQKTSRFWCSALVGYIYVRCGALHPGTDWSMIRPSDFEKNYLQYINGLSLNELTELH